MHRRPFDGRHLVFIFLTYCAKKLLFLPVFERNCERVGRAAEITSEECCVPMHLMHLAVCASLC